ncbi:pyocin knob domain-containing protein [Citrobacter portucalensis]|uniref:pyocin knob domain-containing protein n=1 Tax=Citrobacter portucalensis TaxID=1639133 RepID=UPI0039FCB166
MTPEQAKALQRQNARLRSQQFARRKSSQAVSNEQQSEVTDRAPNLYRVPKINIPDNLHDVAKLIQSELQKIESSQSILLSLWQKLQGQIASKDSIKFTKQVVFDVNPEVQGNYGWNCIPESMQITAFNNPVWGWGLISGDTESSPVPDNSYGTLLTVSSGGTYGYTRPTDLIATGNNGAWVQQIFISTGANVYVRKSTNGGDWSAWGDLGLSPLAIEQMRLNLKKEMYAELLALNPGIVIPQTD